MSVLFEQFCKKWERLFIYLLFLLSRYGAAEEDCSRSLELDPNYTKALARRAAARRKLKKYSSAIEDYKRLLSIEPKNKQALTEIAEIGKVSKLNEAIPISYPLAISNAIQVFTKRKMFYSKMLD